MRLNSSIKKDESYPILSVCTNEKKKEKEKMQNKESMRPSHSKHCSYAFVYVYMQACAISSLVLLGSNGLHVMVLNVTVNPVCV